MAFPFHAAMFASLKASETVWKKKTKLHIREILDGNKLLNASENVRQEQIYHILERSFGKSSLHKFKLGAESTNHEMTNTMLDISWKL